MNIEEAIAKVVEKYTTLEESEKDGLKAVWVHETDHAGSYEVDEEWIGVTKTGSIAWAYASGCSCWDGSYETHEHTPDTLKAFTFNHEDMKAEWEKKIIEYAESL